MKGMRRRVAHQLAAALLVFMSFSYQFGANPPIDYPRLLISDTIQFAPNGTTPIYIFEDSEILAATQIEISVYQSAQFYNAGGGTLTLPTFVTPWRRIAATLLDAVAANKSRLSAITQLLDVHLSPGVAAKSLRDQAQALRDADDNSGSFAIIEQVNNQFSFRDRFWATIQRRGVAG